MAVSSYLTRSFYFNGVILQNVLRNIKYAINTPTVINCHWPCYLLLVALNFNQWHSVRQLAYVEFPRIKGGCERAIFKSPCALAEQAFGENFDIINCRLMT
jgi:hypothetical protein